MKFRNTNAISPLSFAICGKQYACDAGGEVEVDPAHVPYVFSRGLMLEVAPPTPPEPAPVPAPAPEPEPIPEPEAKVKAYAPTKGKKSYQTVPRVS